MSFMERLKLVFTIGNTIKVSILSTFTFLICFAVSNYAATLIEETLKKAITNRTEILELTSYKDIFTVKCIFLNCMYVLKNNKLYEFKDTRSEERRVGKEC